MSKTNISNGKQVKILSDVLKKAHRNLEECEHCKEQENLIDIEGQINSNNI
jgi:hypothetical protein